jgi:ABC-2 type transport system ATP-binding protein
MSSITVSSLFADADMTEQIKPAIIARGLSRRFGPRIAVQGIDLELGHGEVLGFLGPNGAGKSTVMRMLTGNLAPSGGGIEICGIDLIDRPAEAKARIGYLPEIPPLYRELTVNEYLRLAAKLHRVNTSKASSALDMVTQRCGLDGTGERLIGLLSKGYQQRVGIAQAIIHDPDVIILDEPTAGLDPNQIREIRSLIRELGAERSVIVSTHILPEVESICDRVQIVNEGRTVFTGSIAMLKEKGIALEVVFLRSTMGSDSFEDA